MASRQADPRHVLLDEGSITWIFPTLTDPAEANAVLDELRHADRQLRDLGQILGYDPDDGQWVPPLNRLTYYRLGPEAQPTRSELISEGWSHQLRIIARLWATNALTGGPLTGPPWSSSVEIEAACDVDPARCNGHLVDQRDGTAIAPLSAAQGLRAAVEWAHQLVTTHSVKTLRARDPQRGHAALTDRPD